MVGLADIKFFRLGSGGGKVGNMAVKYIGDAQTLQALTQIQIGGHIKFWHA